MSLSCKDFIRPACHQRLDVMVVIAQDECDGPWDKRLALLSGINKEQTFTNEDENMTMADDNHAVGDEEGAAEPLT